VGGERFQIALSSKCTWGRCECERPESPDDDAEVRIGRGLKYPKDKGYAKFLTTLGYDRNWAGMLAAKIAEKGDQA
jgi:hypothetical protein